MQSKCLQEIKRDHEGRIILGYVSESVPTKDELKGNRKKFWYNFDDTNVLFKETNPDTYEDYAELLNEELCKMAGMPSAHYDLAIINDRKGVLSYDFRRNGSKFVAGSIILKRYVNTIEENEGLIASRTIPGNKYNNLQTIKEALSLECSESSLKNIMEKLDLLFGVDCLGLQSDRHWNNWGVLSSIQKNGILKRELAPQFDGGCLCRFAVSKRTIARKLHYLNMQSRLPQIQKILEKDLIPGDYDITCSLHYDSDLDKNDFGISRLMKAYSDDPVRFNKVIEKLSSIDPYEIIDRVEERIKAQLPFDCTSWFVNIINYNLQIMSSLKKSIDESKGIYQSEQIEGGVKKI